jgi:hypothetical protein
MTHATSLLRTSASRRSFAAKRSTSFTIHLVARFTSRSLRAKEALFC